MITTGLIKQINISTSAYIANKYLVELNIFQVPGDNNKKNYTYQANCLAIPGQYSAYKVGDKVYVGFLNNDLSLPIILGKIYQGLEEDARSAIYAQNITVTGRCDLPTDTTIGDIKYKQLLRLFNKAKQSQYRHIILCATNGQNNERVKLIINSRFSTQYRTEDLSAIYKNLYNMYQDTPIIVGIYDIDGKYLYESTARINTETLTIELNLKEETSIYDEQLDITHIAISAVCKEVTAVVDDYIVEI